MATINLGKIKPVHRGTWNTSSIYKDLDLVRYETRTYICTAKATVDPPTNTADWALISVDGFDNDGYNNVGSLVFAAAVGVQVLTGGTVSGSSLRPASATSRLVSNPYPLSGSWRCLGYCPPNHHTLFIRIS